MRKCEKTRASAFRLLTFLLFLAVAGSGCVDYTIPDIETDGRNLLENPELMLFSLERDQFLATTNAMTRRVRLFYASAYDQLTVTQQQRITGIRVRGENEDTDLTDQIFSGSGRFTSVREYPIGSMVCFDFLFVIKSDTPTELQLSRPTEICVTVRER